MTPKNNDLIPSSPEEALIAAALIPQVGDFLKLFYQDIAQPSVKKVGIALSDIIGLTTTLTIPFRMVSEKAEILYKVHMENFRKKVEDIPQEKIIPIQPEIGVPIFENLGHTTNNKIAEMYLNLLKNASSSDTVHGVHPRFSRMVASISSDEAKILEAFEIRKPGTFGSMLPQEVPCLSLIAVHLQLDPSSGQRRRTNSVIKALDRVTEFEVSETLQFPENAPLYFNNLTNLGVLEFSPHESTIANYSKIYNTNPVFKKLMSMEQPDTENILEKGVFRLTRFGEAFIKACRDL